VREGGPASKACCDDSYEVQIPRDKYKIISKYHNSVTGHLGYKPIMQKLRLDKHKWTNMGEHVKIFFKTCSACQKMSQIKPTIYATPFTNAAYRPIDVLNVDSIGPVTTDLFGNCYIIVIICCFTRFLELYSAPDTSALAAARALLGHHGRYGVPHKIRTDRGSQYANRSHDCLLQRGERYRRANDQRSHETSSCYCL
jgi:hypothetical protein